MSDENEAELVRRMTAAMREADIAFDKVGGSTRHHARLPVADTREARIGIATRSNRVRMTMRSVLIQPLFQVSELDGARFLQRAGGESTHPVVMHAKRGCDYPVLSNPLFHGLSSLLNAFFYRHAS